MELDPNNLPSAHERALLERDAQWNALLTAMNDAVVVCDERGHVLVANAIAQRMAAQGNATWRRMPLPAGWDIVPAEDAANDAAFPTALVLADARERRNVRVHATRPNGKHCVLDVSVVPLFEPASGRLAGAATTLADVTRRVQLEAEVEELRDGVIELTASHAQELLHLNQMLERSTAFCRAITDAVPAQVAYWERGVICRYANGAFRRWVGRDSQDTLGRSRVELYVAQDDAAVQRRLEAAMQGHEEHFEIDLRGADGGRAVFCMSLVPARGREATVHGVYSIAFERGAWGRVSALKAG